MAKGSLATKAAAWRAIWEIGVVVPLIGVGRRFNDCVAASPRPCQRYLLPLQPLPSHFNVCIIDRWKSELQTKTTQFLRRSITELCQVDHGDDPAVVANWLQNKTPDNVRSWISHLAAIMHDGRVFPDC
jgi:hypothetical protein